MRTMLFISSSLIWLCDMAAMVATAPPGKNVVLFSVLYGFGHILMLLMVKFFPKNMHPQKALWVILGLGIAARLLFVPYPPGNDVYRYVWEGYIQSAGLNPYSVAPDSAAAADSARGALESIRQQVNHPQYPTVYPPLTLLLFRLLASIRPDPRFFKLVMLVFDVGVMVVLMGMLRGQKILPSRLLLYAANPLILVYIAGEGHLDVIQVFFLCAAICCILSRRYTATGFFLLGMAIMSKYFCLVALPFLINAENRTRSMAVLLPCAFFIPFMDAGSGLFHSLGIFASNFHYNDSLSVVMRFFFGDWWLRGSMLLLLICLGWIYLFVHDQLRGAFLALGCVLVFLPTLHPWYLVLMAPFLVFFPSRAWLYLQAAVLLTFPVLGVEFEKGVFQEIAWLKWFEYVPFYGFLVWGLFHEGYLFRRETFSRPQSISVIVPTLNEAGRLGRCLQALKNRTALKEVIVVDGGSTDKTRAIAAEHGAVVVESQKGRGIQIAKGIHAAGGDVILIMHADCAAHKGVFKKIIAVLESRPYVVGGAFAMQFEPGRALTAMVAFLNNLRTFLTGISFGDQAQFFRSEALARTGGFPSMMLMEDVELSLRLKELGRLVFLRHGISVSGRRWYTRSFSRNLMTVLHLFPRYLIERRLFRSDRLLRNYYAVYYPGPDGGQADRVCREQFRT